MFAHARGDGIALILGTGSFAADPGPAFDPANPPTDRPLTTEEKGKVFQYLKAQRQNRATNTAHPGGKLPGNVAIQLVEVAGGFVDPIHVASPQRRHRPAVRLRAAGHHPHHHQGRQSPRRAVLQQHAEHDFQFLEQGLYCIEFHPKFKENGLFYVSYADMWFNGSTFIVEYKVSANDPNKADMASARPIMRIDFPYCNHHGGKIAFGPDGYLYVGVGDGGWEGDVLSTGQDLSTWMGKMLRIDVNTRRQAARTPSPTAIRSPTPPTRS